MDGESSKEHFLFFSPSPFVPSSLSLFPVLSLFLTLSFFSLCVLPVLSQIIILKKAFSSSTMEGKNLPLLFNLFTFTSITFFFSLYPFSFDNVTSKNVTSFHPSSSFLPNLPLSSFLNSFIFFFILPSYRLFL